MRFGPSRIGSGQLSMKKIVLALALALVSAPAAARQRAVIEPLPTEIVGANHVTAVEVSVNGDALENLPLFEAKAAEKRTAKGLAPYDAAATTARPTKEEYSTLPFAAMFPLVLEDVTRDWGLTGGRPVKLKVRISGLKTADAARAILLASSSDVMSGVVTVVDPAKGDAELGSFYIDVENKQAGWGEMLVRGSNIRERLAEEFALETSRMLTGRKDKKIKKAKASRSKA